VEAILALLDDFGVEVYHEYGVVEEGYFRIYCNAYAAPPEFTFQVVPLLNLAKANGADIVVDCYQIAVPSLGGSAPNVELEIPKKELVIMQGRTCTDTDEGEASYDAVEQLPETKMDEIGIEAVDRNDRLECMRNALPEGRARDVFDIYTGTGEIFSEFLASDPRAIVVSSGQPRQNKIAEFLNITTKDVKRYQGLIKTQMYAYDIIEC
jgi:hypothetical protein